MPVVGTWPGPPGTIGEQGPPGPLVAVNGLLPTTGPFSMAGFAINDLSDPLLAQDAATKSYVDVLDATAVHIAGAETITGSKTFTSPILLPAGGAGAGSLGLAFTGDPDTGFYRAGPDFISFVTGGADHLSIDAGGNIQLWNSSLFLQGGTVIGGSGGTLQLTTGLAGTIPPYTFYGDTNTGMWSPSGDTIAFTTGGTERVRIDTSGGVTLATGALLAPDNVSGNPSIAFSADTDTGLRRTAPNQMALMTGGLDRVTIDSSGSVTLATGVLSMSGGGSIYGGATSVIIFRGHTLETDYYAVTAKTGDTFDRFAQFVSGQMRWGPGNATTDVSLDRIGVGKLSLTANAGLTMPNFTAMDYTQFVLTSKLASDILPRLEIYPQGSIWFGPGTDTVPTGGISSTDSAIERNASGGLDFWAANTLPMQLGANNMSLSDGVTVTTGTTNGTKIGTSTTQKLGFFNATPVVRRNAPSTLQSVITALSDLGLSAAGTAALANADVSATAGILPNKLLSGTFQYNVWAPYTTSSVATGATWNLLAGGGAGTEKTTLTVKAYSLAIAFFMPALYNNTTAGTVVQLRFNATISAGGPLSLPTAFANEVTTVIGAYTTCPIVGIWLVPWTSGTPTLTVAVEYLSSNAASNINSTLTYAGLLLVPYV